jgi:hypothetical protein
MPLYPKPALIRHFCRPKFEQAMGICYRHMLLPMAKGFPFTRSLTDLSCKPQEETAQS